MTVAVVVFDLDGTLTDSEAGIVSSFRQTLAEFGLAATSDQIRAWIGPPLSTGLVALGVPPKQIDTAVATFRSYYTFGMFESRLFDGVPEMLEGMGAAGLKLAVATSKLMESAQLIVEHFGIAHHFELVVGASRDGQRRYKEDIVDFALGGLGRPDPAAVVLAGDRDQDVYAALHHGLDPIGVTWGYGSRAELIGAGCSQLVDSPAELSELILAAQTI